MVLSAEGLPSARGDFLTSCLLLGLLLLDLDLLNKNLRVRAMPAWTLPYLTTSLVLYISQKQLCRYKHGQYQAYKTLLMSFEK